MRMCAFQFLLHLMIMPLSAQQLSKDSFLPRGGDKLYKVQMDYTTSGLNGVGVIWDFSKLKVSNGSYRVNYIGKIDSVLCVSESRTQFKYRLSTDSLIFVGYENANIRIENTLPALVLRYPFAYGDSIGSYFYGEGSYSHSLDIASYGFTSIVADGLGSLLLPDGDTLRQVLRVRQSQYINQIYYADGQCTKKYSDCVSVLSDSIRIWLQRTPATWHVVHCQWYAPGYRYPVFETFENSLYKSGSLYKHFNTAFYYPPTEQLYLENDPENQAIRDRIAMAHKNIHGEETEDFSSSWSNKNLMINYTLTSDKQLSLCCQVNQSMQLELILATVSGIVLYHQPAHAVQNGIYEKQINLSGYGDNEFILSIVTNGKQKSQKIICY